MELGPDDCVLLRAATGIGHVIVEALLIILPKKSEGQTRTYRHMKLTFICPTGPCPAETSAASVQLKCTSRRIVTETRPIRNKGEQEVDCQEGVDEDDREAGF